MTSLSVSKIRTFKIYLLNILAKILLVKGFGIRIIRGVVTVNRLRKIDKPLWHNTFSDVYMLCVAHPEPHSKQLYDETKKLLESHISDIYQVCYFLFF